jgi:hypothetical protein
LANNKALSNDRRSVAIPGTAAGCGVAELALDREFEANMDDDAATFAPDGHVSMCFLYV